VESSAINKSLFVLAQCVDAINKKQSRIPYRESKMTRILSLGQNNGLTVMILNLAPTRAYHLDTLASLNFASRTKKIEVCEVENDPIFRTMVKPLATSSSLGGVNMTRQPLRPLAAAHNANVQEADRKKQGQKPVKAFSVYSDSRKPSSRSSNLPLQTQSLRRQEPHKRSADTNVPRSRSSKAYRCGETAMRARNQEAMTKESIEALISRRIDEKLAEKALQDTAISAPALSVELQKRLDDLEQRIDAREDDDSGPGLQFLLMGKQHASRGEDASALRMLRLALPYFPGNTKLTAKIDKLQERIRSKGEGTATYQAKADIVCDGNEQDAELGTTAQPPAKRKRTVIEHDTDDDEFAPVSISDNDDSYVSNASFKYKKTSRRPKMAASKKLPVFRDLEAAAPISNSYSNEQTPRTVRLLKIINTRDVEQIRTLKGVGQHKANAIVNCLVDMDDEEIRDLHDLATLKGVGGKSVETMRAGLSVEF